MRTASIDEHHSISPRLRRARVVAVPILMPMPDDQPSISPAASWATIACCGGWAPAAWPRSIWPSSSRSAGRSRSRCCSATLARDAAYVDRFQHEARAAAARPRQHRADLRSRPRRRRPLHRPGIRPRQEPGRGAQARSRARRRASCSTSCGRSPPPCAKRPKRASSTATSSPRTSCSASRGEVKVADFGLARVESADAKTLTQVGVTMGTPLYMSPEQIEGRAGRLPQRHLFARRHLLPHARRRAAVRGDTALAIAVQHLNATPRPLESLRPEIPPALSRIVHRMIAKKPAERYAVPAELLADLRTLAGDAAAEGWGAGPSDWGTEDWPSANRPTSAATGGTRALDARRRRTGGRRRGWNRKVSARRRRGPAARCGRRTGDAAAVLARRPPRRRSRRTTRATAEQQLAHALLAPSEQAWLAVAENFPDGRSPDARQSRGRAGEVSPPLLAGFRPRAAAGRRVDAAAGRRSDELAAARDSSRGALHRRRAAAARRKKLARPKGNSRASDRALAAASSSRACSELLEQSIARLTPGE